MRTRLLLLVGSLAVTTSAFAADGDAPARSCFADFKPMTGDVGAGPFP